MDKNLTPDDIAECITSLIARNKLWAGKKVYAYFLVNKTAGCFTNSHKSEKYKKIFSKVLEEEKSKPQCAKEVSYRIFSTEYAGHAKDLTKSVIAQLIATDEADTENIIITAGGDGTSLEVQTALYKCAMEGPKHRDAIMNKITLLRLPLGTGNDGTDGHTIEETVGLLRGGLLFTNARAIRVYPENTPDEAAVRACGKNPEKYQDMNFQSPWYAFNIASIGLDAYVVYMTNTVKKKLPGNFYHLCVPLSGVVYDKHFPVDTMKIEMFGNKDDSVPAQEINTKITLLAFGASGNRVYGGGHKILPNENNLCVTPKINLAGLIKENHRFVDGSFVGTDLATLHQADKIRLSYNKAILMQCDGETVMLSPAHFPLIMELTDPCLRVLQPISE